LAVAFARQRAGCRDVRADHVHLVAGSAVAAVPQIGGIPDVCSPLIPLRRVVHESIRHQSGSSPGRVFLAVTGAEALYATLRHFGSARPDPPGSSSCCWPSLAMTLSRAGALLIADPKAVEIRSSLCFPPLGDDPMVRARTVATVNLRA